MADKEVESKQAFPAPSISKGKDRSGTLNLDEVDMSINGVKGDAVVSKGRANTFVTKIPEDGGQD